jgi:hypothetical protein
MLEKIKFDKADKVLYEGKTAAGLPLILAPMPEEGQDVVIGLYVSAGGLARSYTIGGQKIIPGTADLLGEALRKAHAEKCNPLFKDGVNFHSEVEESYSSYEVRVKKEEALNYIEPLLSLTDGFFISNDEAENLKRPYMESLKKRNDLLNIKVRKNLYKNSPMKDSYHGEEDTIKDIHHITMRKFFSTFFAKEAVTLFVVGPVDKDAVYKIADSHVFPKLKDEGEIVVKPYTEDYSAVYKTLAPSEKKGQFVISFKFPSRKDIFEKYGDKVFAYYELLPYVLFGKENRTAAANLPSVLALKEHGLRQGGEEAFFYQEFETGEKEELKTQLEKYLSLKKIITWGDFRQAKKAFLADRKKIMKEDPEAYYHLCLEALANSFAAPSLVQVGAEASYFKFKKFLEDFVRYPRSYIY